MSEYEKSPSEVDPAVEERPEGREVPQHVIVDEATLARLIRLLDAGYERRWRHL